jgi:hypothetical protein
MTHRSIKSLTNNPTTLDLQVRDRMDANEDQSC